MTRTETTRPALVTQMIAIFRRDLAALKREVEAYPDERGLWIEVPGMGNSGGTLVLHLAGNLQHYLGTRLGGSSYVRDRPAEFNRRDVSRAELLREIDAARRAVGLLENLSQSDLDADFPEAIAGVRIATGDYLVHLAVHFAYHLGQLDAHRRVVTGQNQGVGAVRPIDLATARPVENG